MFIFRNQILGPLYTPLALAELVLVNKSEQPNQRCDTSFGVSVTYIMSQYSLFCSPCKSYRST